MAITKTERRKRDAARRRELNRRRRDLGLCYCGAQRDDTSWCSTCKAKLREQHYKVVIDVLASYGGRCQCCSDRNLAHLTIDHYVGGGRLHRQDVGFGNAFYRWLKKNNYPEGYRVLCANCNHGRARNGDVCPHFGLLPRDFTKQQLRERKSFITAIENYGGSCVCGEDQLLFLHLDHVNQDGADHRRLTRYRRLSDWAKQNGFPTSLQILCANCNLAKERPHFDGKSIS